MNKSYVTLGVRMRPMRAHKQSHEQACLKTFSQTTRDVIRAAPPHSQHPPDLPANDGDDQDDTNCVDNDHPDCSSRGGLSKMQRDATNVSARAFGEDKSKLMQQASDIHNISKTKKPVYKKPAVAADKLSAKEPDQLDDPPAESLRDMTNADDGLGGAISILDAAQFHLGSRRGTRCSSRWFAPTRRASRARMF